jgi:hypothetical protein
LFFFFRLCLGWDGEKKSNLCNCIVWIGLEERWEFWSKIVDNCSGTRRLHQIILFKISFL